MSAEDSGAGWPDEGERQSAEGLRSRYAPDMALSAVAEQLPQDAGRVEEAYVR
jgi:hypothetical protein